MKTDGTPKFLTDTDGNPVPLRHVSAYDRLRDKKVKAIYARWIKARGVVERCMADCVKDIIDLQGERAKLPNGEIGLKGNFSVSSFDGLTHVLVKQHYNLKLDDRAKQARDIMLAYAESMVGKVKAVAGIDVQFLRNLITGAFKPSSTGALPVGKVLELIRYTVNDPEWARARSMLIDSMNAEKGKAYLIVGRKPGRQHDLETIRLDAADCWPRSEERLDPA